MILLDISQPVQTIVFTSNKHNDSKSFLLEFKSDSSQKVYVIPLVDNLSSFIERSFIYELDTTLFNSHDSGFYSYEIALSDTLEVVTQGKLYIKRPVMSDYVQPESEDNDFIIYNG